MGRPIRVIDQGQAGTQMDSNHGTVSRMETLETAINYTSLF